VSGSVKSVNTDTTVVDTVRLSVSAAGLIVVVNGIVATCVAVTMTVQSTFPTGGRLDARGTLPAGTLREARGALTEGSTSFRDGSGALTDGNDRLGDDSGKLTEGTTSLREGNATLGEDSGRLSDGSGTLADESGRLTEGTGSLRDNGARFGEESGKLTDGNGRLGEESGKLTDGNGRLGDESGRPTDGTLSDGTTKLGEESGTLTEGSKAPRDDNGTLSEGTLREDSGALADEIDTTGGSEEGAGSIGRLGEDREGSSALELEGLTEDDVVSVDEVLGLLLLLEEEELVIWELLDELEDVETMIVEDVVELLDRDSEEDEDNELAHVELRDEKDELSSLCSKFSPLPSSSSPGVRLLTAAFEYVRVEVVNDRGEVKAVGLTSLACLLPQYPRCP
jgi:X-X-X-Leu-X-X-Gly heptad repeat protein